MDTLPYFILLIKQNIILSTLVVSGDVSIIDFKDLQCDYFGEVLQITNFPLSPNDTIEVVSFYSMSDVASKKKNARIITLNFTTKNPKYFLDLDYYFNYNRHKKQDSLFLVTTEGLDRKYLGDFKIFEDPIPRAIVNMTINSSYGYNIVIQFYTDFERIEADRKYMQEILKKR